jgi:hypothetical protein
VSLQPPHIHHRCDGRGIEQWHATTNDVGDSQQVSRPKKGHVTVVEYHHCGVVAAPQTEGSKILQMK